MVGGEKIRAGDRKLEVIHTPGHTPGHISILTEGLLIAGDAVNVEEDGFAGPRERFTPDMEEATKSVHKLSFREFEKEAPNQEVKAISDKLGKEFRGYQQVSVEGLSSSCDRSSKTVM